MNALKELLNNNNLISNPADVLEDCDIVRKSTKANTKKTSIYFQKSSSGVTSLNSENSKIESNDSIRNKEIALNKRQIECSSSISRAGKKIKMDQDSVLNENDEFDAFANYLAQLCTPKNTKQQNALLDKNTSTCKVQSGDGDSLFSTQFLSTQDLDEIDTVVEKEIAPTATELQKTVDATSSNIPLVMCFKDRLESKECIQDCSMDREIGERSILFENEKVTNNYRHEVNQIFEKIETSICAMGGDNTIIDIDDKYFDLIFNDDMENAIETKENSANKDKTDADIQNIDLNNINLSFGTIIRKALIKNSTKTQLKRINNIERLNLTIQEQTIEFRNLGPFYGLPLKVKHLVQQYKGIEELYDWQDECLKLPAIENKKNLIYALPTSGGKTLVAEILMFRELLCYRRNAIFILPYVSIVQEKVWAISPFGVALDFLVEEYASNKGVYPPRKRRRKNSIYVATIEKALGLINSLIETGRLHEIGLIVVDEFHLIGEEGRGATLEAALTKIKFLKAKIQIIGMSATIGNLPDLCKYLDAEAYTKNFRPVELIEHVKCTNNIAKINWNYKDEEDLLIDYKKVDFKYSESILKLDPDMVGGLVMEVIPEASCLIFCASKKNCENVANLLCQLSKPELKNYRNTEKEQLLHALKDEGGKLCDILKVSIKYGIAYHHSGLTSDERRIIEEGFRAGIIYIICCTSTLAAGVNLPAKRVILRSPYIGKDFINLARYKQMVGRAGRAGLGETGESILIAQPQDMPKVVQLLMSPMNKAFSSMHSFDGKGLRHFLLSCISLGIANTRLQLRQVAEQTLLAVQKDQLEVDIKKLTDKVIKNLFKLGALKESGAQTKDATDSCNVTVNMDTTVQENLENLNTTTSKKKKIIVLKDNTKLVISDLGFAAIKGGLELSRAHFLYEDLCEAQTCLVLQGHLHLLYLVTPYDIAEQIKPNKQVYYEVFIRLKPNELKVAKTLGLDESVAMKLFFSNNFIKTVPERVINRFYLTLMLHDLWNEMPVFEVAEKYQRRSNSDILEKERMKSVGKSMDIVKIRSTNGKKGIKAAQSNDDDWSEQMNRGIVQNLMTTAATFATNVVHFCEELEEFWAYAYLLKGMSKRLSHCCVKELASLMELPAVKQSRAKQLYNAGFKTLQSIAKANADDLVENIEFMSKRVANQLIAASKMLLLERVENLREEAEDVLDGVEIPK